MTKGEFESYQKYIQEFRKHLDAKEDVLTRILNHNITEEDLAWARDLIAEREKEKDNNMSNNERKQYELIQWYPDLPDRWEEGDVIQQEKYSSMYENKSKVSMRRIKPDVAENNPEYWKEIDLGSFEILCVKDPEEGKTFNKPRYDMIAPIKNVGLYCDEGTWVDPYDELEGDKYIHSVKRKTDGQIFKIGDRVEHHHWKYQIEIESIDRDNEDRSHSGIIFKSSSEGSMYLENAEKVNEEQEQEQEDSTFFSTNSLESASINIKDLVLNGDVRYSGMPTHEKNKEFCKKLEELMLEYKVVKLDMCVDPYKFNQNQ